MGLSFITPMLLGGAALVAVPLILHLVMRRRPVPHRFPALRFLRERAVANRRRLRLNHLLLLALRMAALALLAAALARPVLRGAGWLADAGSPVAAALVFDTAPRMALREGNVTRLEQAATLARAVLGKLPTGSRVAVLDTAGGAAAFSPTIAAASSRVDRLTVSTPIQTLARTMADARRLLEGAQFERRELYVFTDCSRGGWEGAGGTVAPAGADDITTLYVDVGAAAPRDYALEPLVLSGERVAVGTTLVVGTLATCVGPAATRAVAVEVRDASGSYVRRAVKPVDFKADRPTEVAFEVGGLEPGTRQGRVIIDGADEFEADNARYFTVEVGGPARVIVAAPGPAERNAALVVQALAPQSLRSAGKARFDPQIVDIKSLPGLSWDTSSGMVLVDPPPLPPTTWQALETWVKAGHGLVVWLGPAAAPVERFNTEASRGVLGSDLVRVHRIPGDGTFIAPTTLDHPILTAFRRVGDAVPWQDFPVTRHWELAAPETGGESSPDVDPAPVVSYGNGLPAILERPLGNGRVVVVTTPVGVSAADPDAWNRLATGFEPWPFVMLANETLLYATDSTDRCNIVAGSPAVLHLDRRGIAALVVQSPAGDDFQAAVDQNRGTVTVTATQVPGNYTLRAGGEAAGVARGFSSNLDPAATDFRRLSPDDLAAALGPGHRLARTEAELARDVRLERVGAELSGWIIVLAALAMAGDWIAANRFYGPRDGSESAPAAAAGFGGEPTTASQPPVPPATVVGPAGSPGPPPLPPVQEVSA